MMNNDFFKGILTGAVAGAIMGMIFDPTRSQRDTNQLKKKAGKVVKTAGNILESLSDF